MWFIAKPEYDVLRYLVWGGFKKVPIRPEDGTGKLTGSLLQMERVLSLGSMNVLNFMAICRFDFHFSLGTHGNFTLIGLLR